MDVDQLRANRRTWDAIAHSFDLTRNKPWASVVSFLEEVPRGGRVLDAGCGNGRHLDLVAARRFHGIGMDLSGRLLRRARGRVGSPRMAWVEGALERPPFAHGSFDAVLCVAALHHVRGSAVRVETIQRLVKLLGPQGRLLVSVWARNQPRFGPGKEPRRPDDGRPVEPGDAMVRWTQHGHQEDRFVHLYTAEGWQRELDHAGAPIERAWPEAISADDEPDNFFAILGPPRRRSVHKG